MSRFVRPLIVMVLLLGLPGLFGCGPKPDEPESDAGQIDGGDVDVDADADTDGGTTDSLQLSEELAFGDVVVGAEEQAALRLYNGTESTVSVTSIDTIGDAFDVMPPLSFELAPDTSVQIPVVFIAALGEQSGRLEVEHDGESSPLVAELSGRGIEGGGYSRLEATPAVLDFGTVEVGETGTLPLTLENESDGLAKIESVTISGPQGAAVSGIEWLTALPETVAPDARRAIDLAWTPQREGALSGTVIIEAGFQTLRLTLDGTAVRRAPRSSIPAPREVFIPSGDDNTRDVIVTETEDAVVVEVALPDEVFAGDEVFLQMIDMDGVPVEANVELTQDHVSNGAVRMTVDTRPLADGVIEMSAWLGRGPEGQRALSEKQLGTAIKQGDTQLSLTVDEVTNVFTSADAIVLSGEVTGAAFVEVIGAAQDVRSNVQPSGDTFELTVPLKRNQLNSLFVCAKASLERVCSAPIDIAHVVPEEFISAESSSRRLGQDEVDELVHAGVISLDNPDNFHVSEFSVCVTYGGYPDEVCYTEPVVLPNDGTPGQYGHCTPERGANCTLGSSGGSSRSAGDGGYRLEVILPGRGAPPVPVLVRIDNRIKTLKEFFGVTVVVANSSTVYSFEDVLVELTAPSGTTLMGATFGTSDLLEWARPTDQISLGDLVPAPSEGMSTSAAASFLVRGDAPGIYNLRMFFDGYIGGPLLDADRPHFAGVVDEQIEVVGPPQLDITVDMLEEAEDGGPFPVLYTIKNVGRVPALYASLEVEVPSGFRRSGSTGGCGDTDTVTLDLGHLEPGASTQRIVDLIACFTGPVTTCSVQSDQNLHVTLEAGTTCPDASEEITDVAVEPGAPTVLSYGPEYARVSEPVEFEVVFDQPIAGLRSDDVVERRTDADTGEILDGDVLASGSVYLERLDQSANQVLARVPLAWEIESTPEGGMLVRMRPGIAGESAPIFETLEPNATYRVGLKAPDIFNRQTGVSMASDFEWLLHTRGPSPTEPLEVAGVSPADGAQGVFVDQVVRVDFSAPVDRGSFTFPRTGTGYLDASVALVEGATRASGDISGGNNVSLRIQIDSDGDRLILTPTQPLAPDTTYYLRIDGLSDIYGNGMDGVFLSSFTTQAEASIPSSGAPIVNPIDRWTAETRVIASGRAVPGAQIEIDGGSSIVTTQAGSQGDFSVEVPLAADTRHELSVTASSSGNTSPAVEQDREGGSLVVEVDSTPPSCPVSSPTNGANVAGSISIEFSELSDAGGSGVVELLAWINDKRVTADAGANPFEFPLAGVPNGMHRLNVTCRDRAGNWRDWSTIDVDVYQAQPPVLDRVSLSRFRPGTTRAVQLEGQNLDALTGATLSATDTIVSVTGPGALEVEVGDAAPLGEAVLTVTNNDGSAQLPVVIDSPRPTAAAVAPSTLLNYPGDYSVEVTGGGFLSDTEIVDARGGVLPTTFISSTSLEFDVGLVTSIPAGTYEFAARNPSAGTFRYGGTFPVEFVDPALDIVEGDITLAEGETRALTVEIPGAAPDGGFGVEISAPGGAVQMLPNTVIPAGETRNAFNVTGVQAGQTVTLTASVPSGPRAQVDITVVEAPTPMVPDGQVIAQPLIWTTTEFRLSSTLPRTLTTTLTSNDPGLSISPPTVDFPRGTSGTTIVVQPDTLGDFSFEATTDLGTSSGAIPVLSRQAVADSTPSTLLASSLGNQVALRVSTDGTNPVQAVRVEVPPTWSTPNMGDVTARLGDGTDVSANVTRGAVGAAPNNGTYLTLTGLNISTSDAVPYVELTVDNLTPLALGDTIWRVEVDEGQGLAEVANHPILSVTGTAADGAGQATVQPDPLTAGSTQDVDLELLNDVVQENDPNTIFQNWTAYGDPAHDWALRDLQTEYGSGYPSVTVLRTTRNADPGYFVSDTPLEFGTIQADIGKFTTSDNDFIGTVVRWQDECNFYLVDWKQNQQTATINGASRTSRTGLALRKVVDCDFDGDGARDPNGPADILNLWDNDPSGNATNLVADTTITYNDFVLYELEIDLLDAGSGAVEFVVSVDGTERMRYTDSSPLGAGGYGPYSFSQADTVFGQLRVIRPEATIESVEVELPMGWPLRTQSDYRVLVGTTDVTSSVGLTLTAAVGSDPATILISGLDLPPGEFLTLRSVDLLVPTAGVYEFVVRTSGPGGSLSEIGNRPTVTVQ